MPPATCPRTPGRASSPNFRSDGRPRQRPRRMLQHARWVLAWRGIARGARGESDTVSEHPTRRRVALVTGSSRGLGSAIAGRLARDAAPRCAHAAMAGMDPDRLRGRRPATTGQVRLRHRQERADPTDPQLGAGEAPLGITANTVAPGFIPVQAPNAVADATRDAYLASVPAGRNGHSRRHRPRRELLRLPAHREGIGPAGVFRMRRPRRNGREAHAGRRQRETRLEPGRCDRHGPDAVHDHALPLGRVPWPARSPCWSCRWE